MQRKIKVCTGEDKCREVVQHWDFEGTLLAENDPVVYESEG